MQPADLANPSSVAATDNQRLQARLKLRPDLVFRIQNEGSTSTVIVEDPLRNSYFQVQPEDYRILLAFTGQTTLEQIIHQMTSEGGEQKQHIETIAQWAVMQNLATSVGGDSIQRLTQMQQQRRSAKAWGRWNLVSIQLPTFNPTSLLKILSPIGNLIFNRWAISLFFVGWLWCGWQLSIEREQLIGGYRGILAGNKWLWLLGVWVVLKLVHELGHGLFCRKQGGEVPQAGIVLLLFTPLAFVNVTSSWRLPNRWQRIGVALAGMYLELWVALSAALIWLVTREPGLVQDLAYNVMLMASINTILFNANPLMRFDGYYVLSDWLGIANLYTKGVGLVSVWLQSLLLGIPRNDTALAIQNPREYRIALIYGVLASVWKYLVCIGLIIAASCLFSGLGVLLALVAGYAWFVAPLVKLVKSLFQNRATQPLNPRYLALSATTVVAAIVLLFWVLQSPPSKSAPAIVGFVDESIVRASADGFFEEMPIVEGQWVNEGQLLTRLKNPELEIEAAAIRAQIQEQDLRAKQAHYGSKIAEYQSALETKLGLEKQLVEVTDQLDSLEIFAPRSGLIVARKLPEKLGTYVKKGDEILSIADPLHLKLIVAIPQQDISSFTTPDVEPLRAKFPGNPVLDCPVLMVNPKATSTPHHRALCADVGGPLPVRSNAERSTPPENAEPTSNVELLEPHFYVEVTVPHQAQGRLWAGQTGWAVFSAQRQSLGSYLWHQSQQWLQQKIKAAMELQ